MQITSIKISYLSKFTGNASGVLFKGILSLEQLSQKLYKIKRYDNFYSFINVKFILDDGSSYEITRKDVVRLNTKQLYSASFMKNLDLIPCKKDA